MASPPLASSRCGSCEVELRRGASRALARSEAVLARAPVSHGRPRCRRGRGDAGAVVGYELLKRPPDVHNADVAFKPQKPPKPKAKTVNWPMFGLQPGPHPLPAGEGGEAALPAALALHRAAAARVPAGLRGRQALRGQQQRHRLRARRGHRQGALGTQRSGASTPPRPPTTSTASTSSTSSPATWSSSTRRPAGSSGNARCPAAPSPRPLVIGDTLYFGCENDQLFALSTRNGHVRWATTLGGPVKSAPAYHRGVLYVGDYGGYMNAVDAKTGKLKWQSGSLGPGLRHRRASSTRPRRSPSAASTPATTTTASTASTRRTGRSPGPTRPAATSTRGRPSPTPATRRPTVYIGSFDGNIYALDAKNGETALGALGRGLGGRLALGGRQHRLRGRVHQRLDQRLRDEDRPPGLPLQDRHLHAGRSPTGAASTWSATRASTRCSRTSTKLAWTTTCGRGPRRGAPARAAPDGCGARLSAVARRRRPGGPVSRPRAPRSACRRRPARPVPALAAAPAPGGRSGSGSG